jgi:DNA-binding response OmpR family regulator
VSLKGIPKEEQKDQERDHGTPALDVLIVDDDPMVASLISAYLEQKKVHIRSCLTGKRGLQLVKKLNPKLVLLDVNLPDSSGFDLCGQIKTHSDAAILYISSETEDVIKKGLDKTKADGYILKPFDLSDLDVVFDHV